MKMCRIATYPTLIIRGDMLDNRAYFSVDNAVYKIINFIVYK